MSPSKPAFFFIAGAFCPGEYFHKLQDSLQSRGFHAQYIDRPTSNQSLKAKKELPGLWDDAEHVRQCVRDFWGSDGGAPRDTDVILVANSYGGAVAYEACNGLPSEKSPSSNTSGCGKIRHLVLLGVLPSAAGTTVFDMLEGAVPFDPAILEADEVPWIQPPPAEMLVGGFFGPLDKAEQQRYAGMVQPMSPHAFTQKLSLAAWQSIPSTFVIGDSDKVLPPKMQFDQFEKALGQASVPLRKVVIAGGEHLSMLTDLDETVKVCLEVAA